MSRHRRQPSRALPLDFNVDDDEGPAAGAPKGATSVDGSQKPGAGSGGVRGDAAKGREGHTSKKKPPAATGGRSSAEEAGKHKSQGDATTGGR
ncbi:hypothetical protein PVAP13_5NG633700 [Panicum virgatum]|jgi:hypothetical protein|uniref:Uncharacterized protein n=1 Tax=Panicum virgatum TaxID=38727 RepID=A0A8T0S853_PANVG|nr:hypothetical protein PVAP13_5NG633700 [Panicum virgatum]